MPVLVGPIDFSFSLLSLPLGGLVRIFSVVGGFFFLFFEPLDVFFAFFPHVLFAFHLFRPQQQAANFVVVDALQVQLVIRPIVHQS